MITSDNGWREAPAAAPRRARGRPAGQALSLEQAAAVLAELAPACAASADVREAWAAWCEYRVNARLPMTPLALRLQARDLAALGSTEAWHALQWSTANQYKGLFAKPKGAPRPPLPGLARVVGQVTAGFLAGVRAEDQRAFIDFQEEARRLPGWPHPTGRELMPLLTKTDDVLGPQGGMAFRRWIDTERRAAAMGANRKRDTDGTDNTDGGGR